MSVFPPDITAPELMERRRLSAKKTGTVKSFDDAQ
jgi:hypothetical protein